MPFLLDFSSSLAHWDNRDVGVMIRVHVGLLLLVRDRPGLKWLLIEACWFALGSELSSVPGSFGPAV